VVSTVVGYLLTMSAGFAAVAGLAPSDKSVILSQLISRALSAAAFMALSVLPPALAAVVLFARSGARPQPPVRP
jgi:hypothetical protein